MRKLIYQILPSYGLFILGRTVVPPPFYQSYLAAFGLQNKRVFQLQPEVRKSHGMMSIAHTQEGKCNVALCSVCCVLVNA